MRGILVLCLLIAAAMLPLSAGASTSDDPIYGGGTLGGPTDVHPGDRVIYSYQVYARHVHTLTSTLILPRPLVLLKKGTPRFKLVNGKPTWVQKNINNLGTNRARGFNFRVRVKAGAKPGKYYVQIQELAQTGSWTKSTTTQVPARVVKPTG